MRYGAVGVAVAILVLSDGIAWGHGGAFRGPGGGGVPPGLPQQPTSPPRTGHVPHNWQIWWGYNQFSVVDFRRRQKERRGPVTGEGENKDADAWRLELREKLVPVMREALRDDDKEVRTAAAVALGKFRAVAAAEELQQLYRDDKVDEVHEAALQGLLLMGAPQLFDFFDSIVHDQGAELRLRGFALMGIGRIGDARSRKYLLDFFDPKETRQRTLLPKSTGDIRQFLVAALIGLQMTGDPKLGETFLRLARDKSLDEDVRAYAVNCIGKVSARDRLPDVLSLLRLDDSDQIRRSAAVVAGVLAERGDGATAKAVGQAMSKDKDKIVRHYATVSLGQIGGEEAFAKLKRHYRYADKEGRGFFLLAFAFSGHAEAAGFLEKELDAADAHDAAAAVLGFGILGDEGKAPPLRKVLADTKAWVLLQASTIALGMLNDGASAPAIEAILVNKTQPAVRTAAAIAYALLRQHAAVKIFTDLLREADTVVVRNAIAQVMGRLASPAPAEPLLAIYRDTGIQRQTRAYALVALGMLADTADFPVFPELAFDTNYFVRCDPFDVVVTIL
jgi:HEAT repeat protein